MEQELIKQLEEIGFIKTDKSVNDSFVLDCKFMQLPNTEIYISDYDMIGKNECLKSKGLLCVFNLYPLNYRYTYISLSVFEETYFKELNKDTIESVMRELLK